MAHIKRMMVLLVCCLLIVSSCQSKGTQIVTEQAEIAQSEIPTESPTPEAEDTEETQEEVVEVETPNLIALVPPCEEGAWLSPVDGARIICIPGGSFQMGALDGDEFAEEDEFPLHDQTVSEFWIYETEVTNVMFYKFVEETGYVTTAEINGYSYTYADGEWIKVEGADWWDPQWQDAEISDNHPVVNVSKADANAYCLWSSNGALPLEAQWEKAARGTELNLYPWGDAPVTVEMANFTESASPTTAGVFDLAMGSSPYGLLHMSGNAAEWISTRYKADYYITGVSFTGLENKNLVRGGSWLSPANELRVSDRQPVPLEIESADAIGFRCVLPSFLENPAYAGEAGEQEWASGDGTGETPGGATGTSESSGETCDMVIPAGHMVELITKNNVDKLGQYAYSDQSVSSSQNLTLVDFWNTMQANLGLFIPGSKNWTTFEVMPDRTLYLDAILTKAGVPAYDDWITFEFYNHAIVANAQDASTFVFLGGGANALEHADGSVSVHIPGAACSKSTTGTAAEEVIIKGYGVETYQVSTLADGNIEVEFFIGLDSYPTEFNAWKDMLTRYSN